MRPGAPKLGIHEVSLITHALFKFQLSMFNGFGVISKLSFDTKIAVFTRFSESYNLKLHDLGILKIGTHDAFIYFYVESKIELSWFNALTVLYLKKLRCSSIKIAASIKIAE